MKLAKVRIENFRHLGTPEKPLELDFTDVLLPVRSRQKVFPKVQRSANSERMNPEALRVVRVERVDDLP